MDSGGRLLIVDDDETWRDILAGFLIKQGFMVNCVADGPSALEAIACHEFDLVLLDTVMPIMGGQEVLDEIRKSHTVTDLPVIMATVKSASEDLVDALSHGANDYLTKPFDFQVVIARIRTQISLKRAVDRILELETDLKLQNRALEEANKRLTLANDRMHADLKAAAKVQEAMLPSAMPFFDGVEFAWHFIPCDEVAGDHLNILPVSDSQVGFFVLDVVGHGVQAALLSVAIDLALVRIWKEAIEQSQLHSVSPSSIAGRLAKEFPWDDRVGKFFTLVCCDLQLSSRQCRFTCAGHPGPIHLRRSGTPVVFDMPGFPIGLSDEMYDESVIELEPGDRLILYTDGVIESQRGGNGEEFGIERFLDVLEKTREATLQDSVNAATHRLRSWQGDGVQRDDVSVLGLELK